MEFTGVRYMEIAMLDQTWQIILWRQRTLTIQKWEIVSVVLKSYEAHKSGFKDKSLPECEAV
jgi:hypothetical protein